MLKEAGERRKHRRSQPWDTVVVFWKNGAMMGMGKLLDISRGGLSVRTYDLVDEPDGPFEIEMFDTAAGFHLHNLPVTFVFETGLGQGASIVKPFRKYGFQFNRMTLDQAFLIEDFLKQHTRLETDYHFIGKRAGSDKTSG